MTESFRKAFAVKQLQNFYQCFSYKQAYRSGFWLPYLMMDAMLDNFAVYCLEQSFPGSAPMVP